MLILNVISSKNEPFKNLGIISVHYSFTMWSVIVL